MPFRADRLVRLRKEKGLSQEGLARELNVSQSLISYYESGRKQPGYDTLAEMGRLFAVSIDYLMGLTDNPRGTHLNLKNPAGGDEEVSREVRALADIIKDNPGLVQYSREIAQREDLQLMVREARNLKPETVRKLVEVMKLIDDQEQ